jgi:hypothetical protein
MGIPEQLKLSGTVYIKYIDDINKAKMGDVLLLLNDDATSTYVGDYENITLSGYIKAKVFDGKVWHNIDISEFCTHRENKFTKKQRAIDSALLCRDIISSYPDALLRKTYRGHFVRDFLD